MRLLKDRHLRLIIPLLFFLTGFLLPSLPLTAAERAAPNPSPRDKCPVCGMFVAKYPDWLAVVSYRDGSHVFFDGAKDMFKYLHNRQKYDPGRKSEDIKAILVTDYYSLTWIDAHKAWYVLGSDVYGPMGRELIPLAQETEAREFLKDHKGEKIIRFPEATREVIKALD